MERQQWLAEQQRPVVNEYVAKAERQYIAQSNPLFAWNAICHLLALDMPLPQWCLDYLKACAFALNDLTKGVVGLDWEADLDGMNQRRDRERMEPKEAAAQVSVALGLLQGRTKTKNMFAELSRYVDDLQDGALISTHEISPLGKKVLATKAMSKVESALKARRPKLTHPDSRKRKIRDARKAFKDQ